MPVHTDLCYEHEIDTECLLYNADISPLHNFQQTLAVLIGKTMLYTSMPGVLNKIKDTLRELEYKSHIIAISETWFKENNWVGNEVTNFDDAFLGYKLYCNSRNNKTGGGVAIFVCKSLLRNCQSPNIYLRNIAYAIDECFESIFY